MSKTIRRTTIAAGAVGMAGGADGAIVFHDVPDTTATYISFDVVTGAFTGSEDSASAQSHDFSLNALFSDAPAAFIPLPGGDKGVGEVALIPAVSQTFFLADESTNLSGSTTAEVFVTTDGNLSRLAAAQIIGSGNSYAANSIVSYSSTTAAPAGEWISGTDRGYMGLRFELGGETHYGWADLGFTTATRNFYDSVSLTDNFTTTGVYTLYSFAYEDVAGDSIAAGAVPETSSAALLVMGAVGAGALRRRRK